MMRVLCPAKINLHLRVGRRRADGFHPLLSWFTTVGLFDTLTVEDRREAVPPGRERAGAARILLLSSDLPGLAADESNLVVRAAEALAHAAASRGEGDVKDATGGLPLGDVRAGRESGGIDFRHPAAHEPAVPTQGVREGDAAVGTARQRPTPQRSGDAGAGVRPVAARLEKQIPLGAGLGGGSSDAARTLVALNRYWHLDQSMHRLAPIAATLGSDVPFFLYGPSSVCTGRGEIVKPVPPPAMAKWVVLILPDIHMPTAAVYGRFDELGLGFDEHIDESGQPDWREWSSRKSKDLLVGLVNDLERPAFEIRKDLGTLRAGIELKLGRPVRMSGSGSSLFTLYDEKGEAEAAANVISASFGVPRTLAAEMTPTLNDDLAAETNNVAPPPR
jgi:4-diphosphocytidyl-2C-methyl-D-erythritol kinase